MTKLKVLGIGLILLFSCKKKIAEFIFDLSRTNYLIKYDYNYKHGKKNSMIDKFYTIKFGQTVDSTISKTLYEYNDKGFLVKEIEYIDHNKNPNLKLLNYDMNDSLILIQEINSNGDTTFIERYAYFPDDKKTIFHREITINLKPNKVSTTGIKTKTYDTVLFTKVYRYENNICKSSNEYDKNKKLSKVVEYEYKDKKIYKEIHYFIFNNIKIFVKTKYLDYSKNNLLPEYYSLDTNNDTIEFRRNKFNKNEIIYSILFDKEFNYTTKVYFKNGREIGSVSINKGMNYKLFTSTTYYDNGDTKEYRTYVEKINAH